MELVPSVSPKFLALQVPTLIFHHGLADDRLHALEDAQSVAQDMPQGQLLVEAVARQHQTWRCRKLRGNNGVLQNELTSGWWNQSS